MEAEVVEDEFVEFLASEHERQFVDGGLDVEFLDDGLKGDVAEEGYFFADGVGEGLFGAADDDVGLDALFHESADGVLGGFGLDFAGGLQVWDERQVNVEDVCAADIMPELADGLKERLAFDVADGAADFGDDDVDVVGGDFGDGGLYLVGDVRDDLDGGAEVLAAALAGDNGFIDAAGGVVGIAGDDGVGEAFVVSEVEVGLGAVLGNIDLAVLEGVHGAGVDVEIGVELSAF